MLNFIRKKIQGPIIQFVLVLIILAFVATIFYAWGMGDAGGNSAKPIAVVGNYKISYIEYKRAYENKVSMYKRFYPKGLTQEMIKKLKLKEGVLDGLINRHILLEKALEYKMSVTDKELKEKVQSYPQFQENGAFSFDKYKAILKYQRLAPAEFEESLKEDILTSKVSSMVKDNINVSEVMAKNLFTEENEKVKTTYASFKPVDIKEIKPSEEDLKKYYDENKESFKSKEKVKVAYLFYQADKFASDINISDNEIESYYDANIEQYKSKKKVSFRQIILKTVDYKDQKKIDEVKKRAEEIRKEALSGEDFSKLAKEYSEDERTASNGGSIGFFGENQLMPSLRPAFSLKAGEVSAVMKSPTGYHILKVEEVKEATTKPISEVKAGITKTLSIEKSKDNAYDRASQDSTDVMSGRSFEDIAKTDERVSHGTTDFFGRRESVKGIGRNGAFINGAFGTETGSLSDVLELPRGFYIVKPIEKKAPEVMPFKDTLESLKKEYIVNESKEIAKRNAEKFRSDVLDTANEFEKTAGEYKAEVKTKSFTRRELGRVLLSPDKANEQVFNLEKGGVSEVIESRSGSYVLKVLEKIDADMASFEKKKEEIIERIKRDEQEKVFGVWLADIKSRANIEKNEEFM